MSNKSLGITRDKGFSREYKCQETKTLVQEEQPTERDVLTLLAASM